MYLKNFLIILLTFVITSPLSAVKRGTPSRNFIIRCKNLSTHNIIAIALKAKDPTFFMTFVNEAQKTLSPEGFNEFLSTADEGGNTLLHTSKAKNFKFILNKAQEAMSPDTFQQFINTQNTRLHHNSS